MGQRTTGLLPVSSLSGLASICALCRKKCHPQTVRLLKDTLGGALIDFLYYCAPERESKCGRYNASVDGEKRVAICGCRIGMAQMGLLNSAWRGRISKGSRAALYGGEVVLSKLEQHPLKFGKKVVL